MIHSRYKRLYNTEKVYPHKSTLRIYKTPQYILLGEKTKKGKSMNPDKSNLQSLLRTKTTIRDVILCNHFDLFTTFTFKNHRDNIDICKARMQEWLKSQQKIHGKFYYLIVPEFHKDGKSIHFHALLQGYKGKLTPAKNPKNNNLLYTPGKHLIFNLKGWRNGFSTASIIDYDDEDSTAKVASYVTKYITKDMPKFFGKKRYWVSQQLLRPVKSYNVDEQPYITDPSAFVESEDSVETYTKHYKQTGEATTK